MFKLFVDNGIISFVEGLLQKYNFGQRGFADGNWQEQRTGLIGQTLIQEKFGCGRPNGSIGFDGGEDFKYCNKIIDVKTMGRKVDPKPDYVNNFIGLQKNYPSDILIFCSYNKISSNLTVCGWTTKKDFFNKASFHKQGDKRFRDDGTYFITKADLYEIENYKLNSPNSMEDLISEITQVKLI